MILQMEIDLFLPCYTAAKIMDLYLFDENLLLEVSSRFLMFPAYVSCMPWNHIRFMTMKKGNEANTVIMNFLHF